MSDAQLQDRLQALLAQRPLGLLTDIDGTLSPIAGRPEEARIDGRCQAALRTLAGRLELVATVSGRAAADAARLVGLDELLYIGNHGLERWEAGEITTHPEAEQYREHIASAMRRVREGIDLPGMALEDKGVTASVHYRRCPDPALAREAILRVLEPIAASERLILSAGRKVWELRPPLRWDKGVAAAQLVEQHGLRSVIFLGDDLTDVHAFKRLATLRQRGALDALLIGIASRETPYEVIDQSDVQVNGVEGAAALLEALVELTG